MKKGILLTAAFAALAPLAIVAGSAQAATNYVAQHVYTFDSEDDSSYAPDEIVSFGDKVAIELNNGELWISDGTEAGTDSLEAALTTAGLTDWGIQRANDEIHSLDIDGELYFFGYNGTTSDIYKTNGTTVTRVTSGLGEWDSMYYFGGKIYVSDDGVFQVNPSTGAIVDVYGPIDCTTNDSTQVQLVGGKIVFVADDNNCDDQLYTWDPASPGTAAVAITAVSNGIGNSDTDTNYMDDTNNSFTMFNGEMYFAADGNDGTNPIGVELFKTNGTQAGTVLVKDLVTGVDSSSYAPEDRYMNPTVFGGELYFTDNDGVLYKTDGTTVGTSVVNDESTFQDAGAHSQSPALIFNGTMITDFYTGAIGDALYTTDGTVAGTELLVDPNPNGTETGLCYGSCNPLVEFDGHAFFIGFDGDANNVWVTDGTPAGSYQVSNFGAEYATGGNSERALVKAGDNLFFAVSDDFSDGGTGEMALYKIGTDAIAPTGADLSATSLSSLVAMALVALAGAAVIARRRITKA